MIRNLNRLIALLLVIVATPIFAQHSLQLNQGPNISTIVGSATGGIYTLPATSGTLVTTGSLTGFAWMLVGNSLTGVDGTDNLLGSLAGSALTPVNIVVNGNRAMRYVDGGIQGVAITGGYLGNSAVGGSNTIAGGGASGFNNTISSSGFYNTIGGGGANLINGAQSTGTIGGGGFNQVNALRATVAGGAGNTASGQGAFIGGGESGVALGANNTASGQQSVIGGGQLNISSNDFTVVVGGFQNAASGPRSFVGGGNNNTASGFWSVVGGGNGNSATNNETFVGGGTSDFATGFRASVVGGGGNTSSGSHAAIGGGEGNTANGDHAAVVGGQANTAPGDRAFVGGGLSNSAGGSRAAIGGGQANIAANNYATVGGGLSNAAVNTNATIGGGQANNASGVGATVAGGQGNTASGALASIGGGTNNTANNASTTIAGGSVNTAQGSSATVGGGTFNRALGNWSAIPGGNGLTLSSANTFGYLNSGAPAIDQMIITTAGTATFGNTDLWLANNDNTARALVFFEPQATTGAFPAAGINFTAFKAGVQAADITYTLPTAAPAVNGYILSSTTTGTMSWIVPPAGGGGPVYTLTSVNGAYAVLATDQVVQVDLSTSTNVPATYYVITLPAANTFAAGQTIILKGRNDGGAGNGVHITTTAGEFIDDVLPPAAGVGGAWDLTQGTAYKFYSTGAGNSWYSY